MARPIPGSERQILDALTQLLQDHGLAVVRAAGPPPSWLARLFGARPADRLTFPDHPGYWIDGEAYPNVGHHLLARIDVRFGLPDGRVVVESFTGLGDDPTGRVADGVARFALGALHVLLTAFFARPAEGLVTVETWDIAGRPRAAVLGPVVARFTEGSPGGAWLGQLADAIRSQPVPPGDHWVRLYMMRQADQVMGDEVLLDNVMWPPVRSAAHGFAWPTPDGLFDARVFLVIRDAN